MPEVTSYKPIAASQQTIWDYVKDIGNWAEFIIGYQHHELIDDRRSTWTVKGELGALSRTVSFEVLITEWVEPERVRFTLSGLTERFDGEGSFAIGIPPGEADIAVRRPSPLRRLLHLLFGRRTRRAAQAQTVAVGSDADQSGFGFDLSLQAGGMTGPVVNAMMEPIMRRAADDLADRLSTEILRRTAAHDPGAPAS